MTQATYTSGLLFTRAHKAVRARIYSLLEKYDLNPTGWSILGITTQSPDGVRLASVAKQIDVKAPLVTMIATELIEKQLITRVQHHTDGRAKLLVATAKGRKLAAQIETELSSAIAQLMEGASAKDIASFQKTLQIIIANADKMAS